MLKTLLICERVKILLLSADLLYKTAEIRGSTPFSFEQ